MSETQTAEKARRITVAVDVKVVIEPGYIGYHGTIEDRTRALDRWAREFEEWVRDHRSQDPVALHVERVTRDECDRCSNLWETYDEDGKTYCAGCGREVESPR